MSADYLSAIVERKRRENARRARRERVYLEALENGPSRDMKRGDRAIAALTRREGEALRVISAIKFRSPIVGMTRPKLAGEAVRIAHAYAEGGAGAISDLADRTGYGGLPLEVR